MKKSFFYLFATAAMFASCCDTTEEDAITTAKLFVTASEAPIALDLVAPMMMDESSRGTGTVGSTSTATNTWQGQIVNLFMYNKGTFNPTQIEDENDKLRDIFNNTAVKTPTDKTSGRIVRLNEGVSYYPISGASDFWALHLDGADKKNAPVKEGTKMTMAFTIDGTQDIMVGKTNNNSVVLPSGLTRDDLYSAKSSRLSVVPELEFAHLLTRLTFSLKAYSGITEYSDAAPMITKDQVHVVNNESMVNEDLDFCLRKFGKKMISTGVFVDSIMVESATTGKVVFAYTPDDADKKQMIIWDTNSKKDLTLRERPVKNGKPMPTEPLKKMEMMIVPSGDAKAIGEALLLKPGEKYNLRVAMHQYVSEGITENTYIRKSVLWPSQDKLPHIIDLSKKPGKGGAGYSYNIQLNVSGLEEIKLEGMLQKWEQGGQENVQKDVE